MSQANKIKESDYTSTPSCYLRLPPPPALPDSSLFPSLGWKVQEVNTEPSDFLIEIKIKPILGLPQPRGHMGDLQALGLRTPRN